MHSRSEEYVCNKCGFISPVPNERCPECDSPMSAVDSPEPQRESGTDQATDETELNSDGTESLEGLREKEEQEDEPGYDEEA